MAKKLFPFIVSLTLLVSCSTPTPQVLIVRETVVVTQPISPQQATQTISLPTDTVQVISPTPTTKMELPAPEPTRVPETETPSDAPGSHDMYFFPRPPYSVITSYKYDYHGYGEYEVKYSYDLTKISQDEMVDYFANNMESYGWILSEADVHSTGTLLTFKPVEEKLKDYFSVLYVYVRPDPDRVEFLIQATEYQLPNPKDWTQFYKK